MISLCIPTYERTGMLFESFAQVVDDDRISEIVIVDDCSSIDVFKKIQEHVKDIPKVKLYRNKSNLDCYRNKKRAVELATNECVIIFDSDNVISPAYVEVCDFTGLDCIPRYIIQQPSFAKPHFDFRKYEDLTITKYNVAEYISDPIFQTMLNAMNYCVNRDEYLRVWDGSIDPVTSDSLYQNYRWLEAGNSIYVESSLEYEHRVHDGSHYRNNIRRTPQGFHDSIIEKLKQMR